MTKQNRFKLLPLSLALTLVPVLASAEDLIQIYDLARQNDAVLAGAEAQRLATRAGVTQATSQLLPQINASYSFKDNDTSSYNSGLDLFSVPAQRKAITTDSDSRTTTLGAELTQSILDFSKWTARKAA